MIIYWGTLEQSANSPVTIPDYIASDYFANPLYPASVSKLLSLGPSGDLVLPGKVSALGGLLGVTSKIGLFSRDVSLASGDQSVTGVGFIPKMIFLLGLGTNGTTDKVNLGIVDSDGNYSVSVLQSGGNWYNFTNRLLNFYYYGDSGKYTYAVLKSLDSDGFTLTWTKVGAPTGTANILYLAIG